MTPPSKGSPRRAGSGGGRRSTGRRGASLPPPRRYPRLVRVNENLREILAEAIARLGDTDERLHLTTVTGVDCEADFRAAVVLLSSLDPEEAAALDEARVKLQAIVGRQVTLKRTPLLRFAADPAVAAGQRIEEILRDLGPLPATTGEDRPPPGPPATGEDPTPPPGPAAGEDRPPPPGPAAGEGPEPGR